MRTKLTDMLTARCTHSKTIIVRSAGMERIVCQGCGHVSFSFDGAGPYPVDADRVELIPSAQL